MYGPCDAVPKPWKNNIGTSAHSFSQEHRTVFHESTIPGAGRGWFADMDIPAGVRLRRVTLEDGSLLRFPSEKELRATGWSVDEAVHYGIGHKKDRDAVFYLNPGTPCNHGDPSRVVSAEYHFDKPNEMELWSVRGIKAGEEIFIDYTKDYGFVDWYDKLCEDNCEKSLGANS